MADLTIEQIKALERVKLGMVSWHGSYEIGDAPDALRGVPALAVQRIFGRLATGPGGMGEGLISRSGSDVVLTEAGEAAYLAGWTPD